MERNEVLKKSIKQNCNLSFLIEDDLFKSIDALANLKSSCAKELLRNVIQDFIIANWKNKNYSALKMVCKEINLEAGKGFENGKVC